MPLVRLDNKRYQALLHENKYLVPLITNRLTDYTHKTIVT